MYIRKMRLILLSPVILVVFVILVMWAATVVACKSIWKEIFDDCK